MNVRVSHRGFFVRALCALSLWLGASSLAAAAFDDIPWALVGTASTVQTGDVALTGNTGGEAGAMWDPCAINLNESFDLTFTINMGGDVYGCGADGMAFVLQTGGVNLVGDTAAAHAYAGGNMTANSLAVGLDTWTNNVAPYNDPPYESLGIEDDNTMYDQVCYNGVAGSGNGGNGTAGVTITGPCRPSILADGAQATDTANHQVEFVWTPNTGSGDATLSVVVDSVERATWTIDNYATIFGGSTAAEAVYFGITGATGGGFNLQQAALDAGSLADNGEDVGTSAFCAVPTPTLNTTPADVPTPQNACSVTQPPTFTVSETSTITGTFTVSPTASPTFTALPTDCGTPTYVANGATLLAGQPGNSAGAKTYSYTVPSVVADALVLVEVVESSEQVSSMTFGGAPLSLYSSQAIAGSASGTWAIYEMTTGSLAAGATTLSVTYDNTDNSATILEIYVVGNVNQTTPFGATNTQTQLGNNNTVFTRTITPAANYSMIMDFMVNSQTLETEGLSSTGAGQHNTNVFTSGVSGYNTWSDYMQAGVEGIPASLTYDWTSPSGQTLDSWLVEIEGPVCATSPTDSYTVSPTKTTTDSPTSSFTPSPTVTFSDSPTQTFTASPSDTFSDTPTLSDTPSDTPTATESSTFTDTATPSDTPTQSDTPSDTPTATESSTFTDTATPTDKPSATPSFTQSFSFTDSPTSTDTPTDTPTATPTLTSTQSLTFTYTSTDSDTPTDTPTFTQSFTFTLTDTPTDTPTVTNTFTFTSTHSDTPTFTVSPTFSASPTITNTPIPAAVNVTVSVYNSAGERVAVLYQGGAESVPGSVSLGGTVVVAGSQSVQLNVNTTLVNGQNSVSWNGTNNNGQVVAGGAYYFQVIYVNNFGNTTTYNQPVQVLGQEGSTQAVSIFNSAGELVWTGILPAGADDTAGLSLGSSVVPLALDPSTGALATPLSIKVGASTVLWNGRNLQGAIVGPGTYSVELSGIQPGGEVLVQTKQFVMLASASGQPSGAVVIVPNPWREDQPLRVYYQLSVGLYGEGILYNLAGQRVASASDPSQSGSLVFPASHHASGVYLLDFSQTNGANSVVRKISKIAIVP